jgi:3',5'-cyclic-AMP phosphodiesterase
MEAIVKKLAWVTDIHLDFLDRSGVERFFEAISRAAPDILLVGGDIGEADSVFGYLQRIAETLAKPVYFVFGNHDYYNGSIEEVRKKALETVQTTENLFWLETAGVVRLTRSTALVGHGAWGDGRLGDYDRSPVRPSDFYKIRDFQGLDRMDRLKKLKQLGDEAADYLHRIVTEGFTRFSKLIVLTHVPPFKEACLYQGKIGDSDWLPFFTCGAVGRVLTKLMQQNPDKQMRVLCGHSHHAASLRILSNLSVQSGAAEYGSPVLQSVFRIE